MVGLSWLLLTVPLALLLAVLHPRVWVPLDVKKFVGNGAKDTLLRTFHRQRAWWRGGIGLLISVLAAWPIRHEYFAGALLATAVVAWQLGWWLFDFNPRLNLARKLEYVGKYHVSWNPAASYLDRYVWHRAWLQVRRPDETAPPAREDLRVVAVAGPLFEYLLRQWLLLSTVVFVAFASAALLILVL